MTLRIGIAAMPYTAAGVELVREAERLGVDSVWVPEFWAGDALTPLAYLAARTSTIRLATGIVQLGARTPAMLAMSALSLQSLSDGRFVLGIGTSGPQVMEGWHGVRFDRPVRRTRETIEIIRTVTAGRTPRPRRRDLPTPAPRQRRPPDPFADGAGAHPDLRRLARPGQPAPHRRARRRMDRQLVLPRVRVGLLRPDQRRGPAAGRDLSDLELTVSVGVEFTDDVDAAARRHADGYAFTFGAMGSPTTNFYINAFERQGFGDDVRAVQELWLAGDNDAARRRVPTAIGMGTNLLGTAETIRERLRLYRDVGVTTLRAQLQGDPTSHLERQIDDLGQLLELVADVNREARHPDELGNH